MIRLDQPFQVISSNAPDGSSAASEMRWQSLWRQPSWLSLGRPFVVDAAGIGRIL